MREKLHYNDTVDYLYSLQKYGIKLGLENSHRLMNILGNPQESFHSIHIAGTNGKGSTSAMIAGILKENGFRVGLYTSPHLVSFTERIRVNNKEITKQEVVELTEEIRAKMMQDTRCKIQDGRIKNHESCIMHSESGLNPTFFEFATAMAFLYFKRKKVQWAVVEVGMGGRLDATNVLLPVICVITNIGLDHTEFLGKDIPEIAFEKAGIIKTGVPVVTAATQPAALKVIKEKAEASGSQVHLYGKDFKGILTSMDPAHIEFDYIGYKDYSNLYLSLTGRHQLPNAAIAIRVCEILTEKGFLIYEDAIRRGLSTLNFEGRLELVCRIPPIILDGAHNPPAAEVLATAMKELFPQGRIILIAGIMKDKDIEGILKPLTHISQRIILTRPRGERAASPEILKGCIKDLFRTKNSEPPIMTTNTVAEAIRIAKTLYQEGDVILVTGSFYTTGEAKEVLGHSGVFSQLRE